MPVLSRLLLLCAGYLFLLPALGAQTLVAADPAAAGLSPDGLERYETFLRDQIAAGKLPMAESLIYRKGVVGHHAVLGQRDLSTGAELAPNQVYHIMSMTKPIVTVAFMMLFEEGHFRLGDKVADYLPEFAELRLADNSDDGVGVSTTAVETPITIEQVLTHTAGFSHGLGGTKLDNEIAGALYFRPQADIGARVKTLASLPLVYAPGTRWYYSASPDILARLIEVFSGQTVIEFLRERLLDPLGMRDTDYNLSEAATARRVTNHDFASGSLAKARMQLPASGNAVYGGTHGLYSTAADYLRFCRMLLNGGELDGKRYLSRKTVDLMTMNHTGDLRGGGEGFGLGFGVVTDVAKSNLPGSVGLYRWSGAYSTYFFIDPAEDLIAILMSQRSPYSNYHDEMMRQLVYSALND